MSLFSAPIRDLGAARRQARTLGSVAHRPWPLAEGSWLMGQSWLDLLFAHWRVDRDELARVVPPQLEIDVIDGSAWVGMTPFEVRALRLRGTPPPPVISAFAELNLRTYVTVGDRPGIYFLSLDAASRFAVATARRFYRFPYFRARMSIRREGGAIAYRSSRIDAAGPAAELAARYSAHGPVFNASPGTLDAALIERYCAYAVDEEGVPQRAEIHHPPWPLRRARAELETNTMAEHLSLGLEGEPLLHFAPVQDVLIWPLREAGG